ncbi:MULTISPECIES: HtaA domain-containing protein [unclassified Streptomyces]|uniref:HtaA domain-containing protein n=1 Tax=unclassified Streptomyces TaxID=2593676 RepID=UPI0033E75D38
MKLCWSIRQSFERYVLAAGGTVSCGDGARREGDVFVFDGERMAEGSYRFTGSVRFEAHGGFLDVLIADPMVECADGDARMTVAVSPEPSGRRVHLARVVDLAGTEPAVANLRLTVEGARLLGDVYSPGDLLDPLRIEGGDDA